MARKSELKPQKGDLAIWWSNNLTMANQDQIWQTVASPQEAARLLHEWAVDELANPAIQWNASGLCEWDGEDWLEWYDEDGNDIDAYDENFQVWE